MNILERVREAMDADKMRTPNPKCAACRARRRHRPGRLGGKLHPLAGHGFANNQGGWTHPALLAEADEKAAKARRQEAVER